MKRKKELIVVIASLLVIVLSATAAYFTTRILGTGKKVSATIADLKIVFTSGNGSINGTNIEPGWSSGENTFTVKNESDETYNYNIIIKDLVNTFVTKGFLVYKITSTDGGYNMTDFADVPKSTHQVDTILSRGISIAQGKTHTYKVEFKYLESSTVDQTEDMAKKLTGQIFIEKSYQNTLGLKIIEDNPTISERTDFSTAFTTNTANTLYKSTENAVDVYYFAGQDTASTPINNWVKFAGFYWRIIRTNFDGSVRIIFSGTSSDTTEGYIGMRGFNRYSNSPKYVGYMYGNSDTTLENARTNTNDSYIKTFIDNWYKNNLTSYTNYLSKNAIYCNNRVLSSNYTYTTNRTSDPSNSFYFKNYNESGAPTYNCENNKDAFSVNNSEAKLTYPIALITIGEIVFAGGKYGIRAPMWYYTNSLYNSITANHFWWTMTPDGWSSMEDDGTMAPAFGDYNESQVYLISGANSRLATLSVTYGYAVRPVTSLKSCVQWKSGDGSATNPYEIVENGGC